LGLRSFSALAILLVYMLPTLAAGVKKQEMSSEHTSPNTALTKSEIYLSKNLITILDKLNNGTASLNEINHWLLKTKNSSLFSEYRRGLAQLKKIKQIESINSFKKICEPIIIHSNSSKRVTHFQEKGKELCRLKLLTLSAAKSHNEYLSDFLVSQINHFIFSSNENIKNAFVRKIKSNSHLRKTLKPFIKLKVLKSTRDVDKKILRSIGVSSIKVKKEVKKEDMKEYVTYDNMYKNLKESIRNSDDNTNDLHTLVKDYIDVVSKAPKKYLTSKASKNIFTMGKMLSSRARYKASQNLFEYGIKIAPSSSREEFIFRVMWIYLRQDKFKNANLIINRYRLHNKFKKLNPKLQFWMAFTMESISQRKLALKYYNHLIEESPLSYYSIVSTMRLKSEFSGKGKARIHSVLTDNSAFIKTKDSNFSSQYRNRLKLIRLWSLTKNEYFLTKEIENTKKFSNSLILKNASHPDKNLHQLLHSQKLLDISNILRNNDEHLLNFKLLFSAMRSGDLKVSDQVSKNLFPISYLQKVKQSLQNSGIDPLYILSLIRQESAFDPKAKSPVGARGLMQLMPSTATIYNKNVRKSELYNPSTNIKIGIKYLKKLSKQFENNWVYILAAYNAGENRVKRWEKNIMSANSNILVNIEDIPFNETNNYVKYIYRNIFFYKLFESNQKKDPHLVQLFEK
jgi:soluble lytic murein transglycosylase